VALVSEIRFRLIEAPFRRLKGSACIPAPVFYIVVGKLNNRTVIGDFNFNDKRRRSYSGDGEKSVLGLRLEQAEGAKFCLK
jgi:hypothetical protein